jgi:hypothetical protein
MSRIKRAALESLQQALIPAVGDTVPVLVGAQDYEQEIAYPSVALVPRVFKFSAYNDEELDSTLTDRTLVCVGCFEGDVEIRVASLGTTDREDIQEAIWQAFNAQEMRVGVLVTQTNPVLVSGTQFLHQATIAAVLEDGEGAVEWREEMVFQSERYTFITVAVSYPALVVRAAYNMDHLRVAFTEDLTSVTPVIEEEREINQDGSSFNV